MINKLTFLFRVGGIINSTTTTSARLICLCNTDGCNKNLEEAGKIGKNDFCEDNTEGGNTGGNIIFFQQPSKIT